MTLFFVSSLINEYKDSYSPPKHGSLDPKRQILAFLLPLKLYFVILLEYWAQPNSLSMLSYEGGSETVLKLSFQPDTVFLFFFP